VKRPFQFEVDVIPVPGNFPGNRLFDMRDFVGTPVDMLSRLPANGRFGCLHLAQIYIHRLADMISNRAAA